MKIITVRNILYVSLYACAATVIGFLAPAAACADETGFYIGASVGQSFIEDDFSDSDFIDDADFDEEDIGYRVFAGYRPLRFLAVEGGWRDFGEPDDSIGDIGNIETDITAFDAFVVGIIPIAFIDIFGKAGVGFWDTEVKFGALDVDDDGEDFMWGAGVAVRIASFAIRAEWEQIETDHPEELGMASVGVTYTF